MHEIRVGVAGWDYRDWRGLVYPQPRPAGFDPVRHLAAFLDLIEINSTFYGPPAARVSRGWADRVRDFPSFRFTAKLWRRFTHERDTPWSRAEARQTRNGLAPLLDADRLDAVLVQFPWSFRNDEPGREWLADVAAAFDAFPLVVEVRHESWNAPSFFDWLVDRGIGIVNVDQPLFRRSIRPAARHTAGRGYIRVHGRNYRDWFRKDAGRDARYDYLYPPAELEPWADRARRLASEAEVDVVFNNHYRAQAVVNAVQFRAALDAAPAPAPGLLIESYPDALTGLATAA